MKYTKRRPCDNCPFLKDGPMKLGGLSRAIEVANADGFPCHKTVNYDDDEGQGRTTKDSVACAGSLIYHEKRDDPTQMMRIGERLGLYDPSKLDRSMDDQIIDSPAQMVEGYEADAEPEYCSIVDDGCENPPGYMRHGSVEDNPDGPLCTAFCEECGNPVCSACSKLIDHKRVCPDCEEYI